MNVQRFNALSRNGKVGVGCLGLIAASCLCSLALNMLGGDGDNTADSDVPTEIAVEVDDPTEAPGNAEPTTPAETDTPEATAEPTAPPDLDGALASLAENVTELNTAAGTELFSNVNVTMDMAEHPRCTVTVGDWWYAAERFQQERVLESLANMCAQITARYQLRGGEPDETNYPTTSLVDAFGKEVAYKSTLRTVIEDE